MIIWDIVEYAATVIECLICADFTVRFLQAKSDKSRIICYISVFLFDAAVTVSLNYLMLFEGALGFIRVFGNLLIMMLCMKGSFFEKVMVAVLMDTALLLISYTSINSLAMLFEVDMIEIAQKQGFMRLLNFFVTKFAFFIFTRLMIRIKRKDTYMLSLPEWLAIIVVFVITIFVEMEIFNVTLSYNLSLSNPSVIAAGAALIFINIFIYVLMVKISRKNAEHIEFMIDRMQLEVYKNRMAETEKQYDDMKNIRHDMKNHLQCISALLDKDETEKAKDYVEDMLENKLDFIYQYINTGNRVVDVTVNTKLALCRSSKIRTVISISAFKLDIEDVDMCIVLGNLLDNAIEACAKLDEGERVLYLEISQQKSYVKIVIRNPIRESVLKKNPELKTSKADKASHGIGVRSINEVISRNSGMVDFYEEDGLFVAEVWLSRAGVFEG